MKEWLEENSLWLRAAGGIANIARFIKTLLLKGKSDIKEVKIQELDVSGQDHKVGQIQAHGKQNKTQKAKVRGNGHDINQTQ